MSNKLTIKQENFCQEYVNTGNATEAYRRAYNASKMKDEVISVKASELLKSGKVSVRVGELKAQVAEKFEVTREKLGKMLLDRAELVNKMQELAKKDKLTSTEESQYARLLMLLKASDGNKAIDLLSKMFGLNEPEKHEHKHEGINFNILKPGEDGQTQD
jgi:hypothetical protein